MEFKYQYNKTALYELKGQLALRISALPILKNKETALRQEVKNSLDQIRQLKKELEELMVEQKRYEKFWQKFPDVVRIDTITYDSKKIVGVKVPVINDIQFTIGEISWFEHKSCVPSGIFMLENILQKRIKIKVAERQFQILYSARKKTTQKVNLYEKVQIPMLETAILKIKRFLEDEENISKAAQKIVKNRNLAKGISV